jgi:hypothetical protein
MFIKLHFELENSFKIFRAEDIISIDPIMCPEGVVRRYELVLANNRDVVAITKEQAHDLSIQLRPMVVIHPSEYE